MKTLTTEQLFRKISGFKQSPNQRPQMVMPDCEAYFPKDAQGVRRMGFQWFNGAVIEFCAYGAQFEGEQFWGGIPLRTPARRA